MKIKTIILLCIHLVIFKVEAQSVNCIEAFSYFTDQIRHKNYENTYELLQKLRTNCPKQHNAIYIYGAKVIKYKIKHTEGEEQKNYLNDLLKLYDESMIHFSDDFKPGSTLSQQARVLYDYKLADKEAIYQAFDLAYTKDPESFTNPKNLYYYFETLYDQYPENKEITLAQVFDKYLELNEKLSLEEDKLTRKLDSIILKENNGEVLLQKEMNIKKMVQTNTTAIKSFRKYMDIKINKIVGCNELIPIYEKEYDNHKADLDWLQRVASNLSLKECTQNVLFKNIVTQLHDKQPTAASAYYLGILCEKAKDYSCALNYFEESAILNDDSYEKAKSYFKKAKVCKILGRKNEARTNALKAIKYKASMSQAHLLIANLYASSINDCGHDEFTKRAVYWLVIETINKAVVADPSLKKQVNTTLLNYQAKAPTKKDIFVNDMSGKKLLIKCWINRTIQVPEIN